jgi:lipopolysaccharide/colanic/teichoic acid biosynthesis glycosyltransferase
MSSNNAFRKKHFHIARPDSQVESVYLKLIKFAQDHPNEDHSWFENAKKYAEQKEINEMLLDHFIFSLNLFYYRKDNLFYTTAKYLTDKIFALTLLILCTPLYLIFALIIKLTSTGPAFYRQPRIGKLAKPFFIYKFRTMYEGSEAHRATTSPLAKIKNDPRITPIGRFLRKWKFDELPQFFNILIGDMSFVGPRPLTIEESATMKTKYSIRYAVKPGLTGLWQVKRPHTNNGKLKIALDALYARKKTFLLDVYLLVMTFPVLLKGEKHFSELED